MTKMSQPNTGSGDDDDHYRLFAAAFLVVRLADLYSLPRQLVDAHVACEALLAAWGRSDVARIVFHDTELSLYARFERDIARRAPIDDYVTLARQQPFMDERWQPSNDEPSRAVRSLGHEWQYRNGPWTTNRQCVGAALNYCWRVGRHAIARYRHLLPAAWRDVNADDRSATIELGAQLADIVTPYDGESTVSPTQRCGYNGNVCDQCQRPATSTARRRRSIKLQSRP